MNMEEAKMTAEEKLGMTVMALKMIAKEVEEPAWDDDVLGSCKKVAKIIDIVLKEIGNAEANSGR